MGSILGSVSPGNLLSSTLGTKNNFEAAESNGQTDQANQQTQDALKQQEYINNLLNSQNGIGNQNQIWSQQGNLNNQLAQTGGVQSQQNAAQNAQSLMNQLNGGAQNLQGAISGLQGVASGTGPNPALTQLAQTTGQNTANQAALMAGQRGSGANAGLMARQIGQQGAANQQSAAGQAATLQAQQQLSALGQIGNLAGTQIGAQQASTGQLAGIGANQVGQQQAGLNAAQNLANTQAANQIGGMQNYTNANLTNQGQALNQLASQNQINSGVASQNSAQNAQMMGGLMQGAGSAAMALLSKGGEVENPKLGAVDKKDRFPSQSMMPPHLKQMATLYHGDSYGNPKYQEQTKMAHGGMAKHKNGIPVAPEDKAYSGQTNSMNMGSSLKAGGKVPGQAKVSGDSEKNDTVKAKLSPGEVVIPRSVMNSRDPVKGAADFVAALEAKKGSSKKNEGEFKEALKKAMMERKSK